MDQRGPIGFGGGDANLTRHVSNYPVTLNLYRNVFNSPTNLFDPTGYFPQDDGTANGNSGQSYNPTIPAGSETWVWPWDEGADWSFGSTTTLWWNKSTYYGGAASHGFFVTGGKGFVNGGASAITATVTLGGKTDVELIAPTDNDIGYGASKAIVQGSSDLLIGTLSGGTAAALSKGSRVSQVAGGVLVGYDALGNAANAGRGVHDAFQDGINLDNATRIAGGAAGLSGNLIPNIKAPRSGASSKILSISDRNLQKAFTKHGSDFGLAGNWNPGRAADVSRAINTHINSPGVQTIKGTYRGQGVIHYLDPNSGINIISDPSGGFIGGWKLGADQLKSGRVYLRMGDYFMDMTMTQREIVLKLTKQEAVVFFEWLAKVEPLGTTAFQHPSEEKVVWTLQGQLESVMSEPFAADYADIVAEARRLVESGGT